LTRRPAASAEPSCPCGPTPPRPYAACCGRYVDAYESLPAPTAEALMRSRYSAYVRDRSDYLLATWHPHTRPVTLEKNPAGMRWIGLTVRGCSQQDAHHAQVEFVALGKQAGRALRLHETSRFLREEGRWFYLDGDLA
jgi:SEC-C motif domain protein